MKDWKQVLMGLCKVKSIVTLLLTGTFMALALRGAHSGARIFPPA